jgi:pyruvate,water dikinase
MSIPQRIRRVLTWRPGRKTEYPFALLFSKFQSILAKNNQALELIADMGDKLGGDYIFDRQYIISVSTQLSDLVHKLIYDMNTLAPKKYIDLINIFEEISQQIEQEINGQWILPEGDAVIPYRSWNQDLSEEVGNKNANLAEIRNVLELATPEGFAITTSAFRAFMEWNKLDEPIQELLLAWNDEPERSTEETAAAIEKLILGAEAPPVVRQGIIAAAAQLSQGHRRGNGSLFAVRSSAWGEDTEHSFAGQYKSFLAVPESKLLDCYKAVLASAYSASVLEYRREKGFLIHEIAMAACCQAMIETKASGVLYTIDPASPESDTVIISAAWGLGPPVVEGKAEVDQYVLSRDAPHSLKSLKIVHKTSMLVAEKGGGTSTQSVPEELESKPCLSIEQMSRLSEMALLIERYFKRPQDVEWALDGNDNLVILQARSLRIKTRGDASLCNITTVRSSHPVILEGQGIVVQQGVATGKVVVVEENEDLSDFPLGSILVTGQTSPRLARVIRKVHGIITDVGSPTGHMATIAREFRVPTIVNTKVATRLLKTGDEVTMDATQNVVFGGIVRELCYYEFTEEPVFAESYEYRLLRRILRKISPLNLVDPHHKNFTPAGCRTYHDIIRFIHEKAVEELIHLEAGRWRSSDHVAKRLKFDIPLGLIVIDIGGGIEAVAETSDVRPPDIASIPMRAFLSGLTEPGMWDTAPVSVDFGSFMSSLTRTFSSGLASPDYVGQNLAVISREYFDLSLRLGYHFNIVDAYISDSPNDNYAYFRFIGGVTDIARRSRRAKFIAAVLEEYGFRVEIRGDLVVGRIKKLEQSKMEEKMAIIGCLVAYTRQLDIRMHSDENLDEFLEDFFQKSAGVNWDRLPDRAGKEVL